MAYITEGMGDYAQASLYLSKYYDLHPNPKVISKIKALTDQRELKGYAVSDRTQFFNLLIDYKEIITGIFALLLVISIILLIAKKKTGQVKYYTPAFMLIILVFASNNLLMASKSGIIKDSPTIIMDSPTAAGQLIKKVNPGHRVIIKSKKDIWYEIEWEGAEAWVKQSAVSTL
ncbi:hypothetical protein GCM10007049_23150 [Echinicola pacifica]|uniref:SH3b domain-containing protein n=1 Tax=Echinicola pacifica TaxID=346377 RepID=A0A918URN9_9BACT|nr:SH3 domain-containing protein [Echinicola pacifica]GGZ29312.1 hypothetical protein GCM10007049_23150 [Echinicola pacifica]